MLKTKLIQIPSLILAAILQVLPVARVAVVLQRPAAPLWGIIMRWVGAAATALGGIQAVSGASTKITNPLTAQGTNGVPFKQFRLTTAPDQAHYWTASGLPSGIVLQGTAGQTFWALNGTPTEAGAFNVLLTAKDQINSGRDRTVSATLVITIVGTASPPVITTQPSSISVNQGETATFSVVATDATGYQWRFNGSDLGGQTSANLSLASATSGNAGTYDVVVSNGAGSVTSSGATLSVNTPPVITSQPGSISVNQGQAATFSVVAAGATGYQWRFNGSDLGGQTSANLSLASVTSGNAGTYDVVVSNGAGSVTSSGATLTVNTPPVITSQPGSISVNQGETATFSVVATGATTYQWRFNGSDLGGQTSANLSLASVTSGNAGTYDVVVSNGAGSVTSSGATLTVNTPPVITSQPSSISVNQGQTATFSVVATGATGYQWRFNGRDLGGQTSANLSLASVTGGNAGTYDVVVSNGAGSVTSSGATLTVNIPPVITSQPSSISVNQGQTATFSVVATGATGYQWRFNGSDLGGQTSANLSLASVTGANAGTYDVVVSNGAGSVTSSGASLTVNTPPVITSQPGSISVNQGQTATFSVVAAGATGYQWRFNGSDLGGQTSANLSLASVTGANAGTYDVVVSNGAGSVTSSGASLTVNTPPVITSQPGSISVNQGQTATFSVVATGATGYQWRFNGSDLSGQTSANLSLASVTGANAGTYDVVVSNGAGSVTSSGASLTVNTPPVITSQPASVSVNQGQTATFSVVATGATSYQWRFNGSNLSGQTSATLTLANVTPANVGAYDVLVSNGAGTTTSSSATLSVGTPPAITTQPASVSANQGQTVTFSVAATGATGYQWRFNGNNLASQTSPILTLSGVTSQDAGTYDVLVSNSAGATTSVPATLSVLTPPVIITQPTSLSVNAGQTVTFTVMATGATGYQWRFNGNNLSGQTGSTLTLTSVAAANAGNYDVLASNAAGTTASSTAVLTVQSTGPVVQPVFTQVEYLPNRIVLTFMSTAGQTYELYETTDPSAAWTMIQEIPQTTASGPANLEISTAGRMGFFRLKVSNQ